MIFKVHDIFYACWQNKCVKYIHQHFETKWRSGTKSTYNFGNQKCHLLLSSSLALPSNRIFEKKTKNNSKYFQSRHFTINPDRFEVLSEEYYDPMWSKIRGGERWVDSRCIQSCNLDSVFAWYYSLSLPPIFFFFFYLNLPRGKKNGRSLFWLGGNTWTVAVDWRQSKILSCCKRVCTCSQDARRLVATDRSHGSYIKHVRKTDKYNVFSAWDTQGTVISSKKSDNSMWKETSLWGWLDKWAK